MMNRPHESELLSKGFLLLLSQYGSMVVSITFTFWLARLLGPSEFGRFAIGVFSFDIYNALTDWGWDQGVFLSSYDGQNSAYSTHLFIRTTLGCVPLLAVLGVCLFAPWLLFGGPIVIAVMLAVAFWCEKVSSTYKVILERSFALRHLAFFEIVALVGSFLCAILAVYAGVGFLALPLQRVLEKFFLLLGYLVSSPWKYSFHVDFSLLKSWITSFGLVTLCGGLLSLFLYDFVGAFVGVSSGVRDGGLYARAFKMATFPLMVTAVFGRITTPLYAHASGEKPLLKATFLHAQFAKACLIIPAQLVLVLGAPWWIPFVLGEQWQAAVVLYQVLAVYGLVRAFYDDVTAVFLYGLRYPLIQLQQHVVQASCMVASWLLLKSYYHGPVLGALVMSGGMCGVAIWIWRRVFISLGVEFSDLLSAVRDIFERIGSIIAACFSVLTAARDSDGPKKNPFDWRAIFKF